MIELAKQYGMSAAALAYGACAQAILDLQGLCNTLGGTDFTRQDSLYYASRPRDIKDLRNELETRKAHKLPVEWIEREPLWHNYGVHSDGAILSRLAASVDPYRLCYRLFSECEQYGARIHDRTAIASIEPHDPHVDLRTEDGVSVRARHVILAAGYGNQRWLAAGGAQSQQLRLRDRPPARQRHGRAQAHHDVGNRAPVSVRAQHRTGAWSLAEKTTTSTFPRAATHACRASSRRC